MHILNFEEICSVLELLAVSNLLSYVSQDSFDAFLFELESHLTSCRGLLEFLWVQAFAKFQQHSSLLQQDSIHDIDFFLKSVDFL